MEFSTQVRVKGGEFLRVYNEDHSQVSRYESLEFRR
jgi:hypothetical protein